MGSEHKTNGGDTQVLNSKLDGRLLVTMDPWKGDTAFEYGPHRKWKMDQSDRVLSCQVEDWEGGSIMSQWVVLT